jgi:hypothetical protein
MCREMRRSLDKLHDDLLLKWSRVEKPGI